YDHGEFNIKDMNKLRININDVLGQMRLKGYYNFKDIDYVIMETNGDVSIVAPESQSAKRIKRIPIAVILDRKIMYNNLEKFNITKEDLDKSLKKENLRYKDVLYGFIDENDKFVFYKR
ncbi:MAG: YetF domain-containing protein, partial [Sedimentibacter sp.]